MEWAIAEVVVLLPLYLIDADFRLSIHLKMSISWVEVLTNWPSQRAAKHAHIMCFLQRPLAPLILFIREPLLHAAKVLHVCVASSLSGSRIGRLPPIAAAVKSVWELQSVVAIIHAAHHHEAPEDVGIPRYFSKHFVHTVQVLLRVGCAESRWQDE